MARRRLSDLLREEAKKPSDSAAETEQSADEPDAETVETAEETAPIEPSTSTKASTAAKTRSTKQTVAADPQTPSAPQQDEALLQKIADLTSTLDTQKETVKQLQTELDQTRKDVRLLTDANAKLTQELKDLQSKKAADTSIAKKAETPAPQALKLAPLPAEPSDHVEASGHPLNSFNRDVGWFD